jgi:hypothetical protein
MIEAHANFDAVKRKSHTLVRDLDNGIAVTADLAYVVSTLRCAGLITPRRPVVVADAFGKYDLLTLNGEVPVLRYLDADTEQEALEAA